LKRKQFRPNWKLIFEYFLLEKKYKLKMKKKKNERKERKERKGGKKEEKNT